MKAICEKCKKATSCDKPCKKIMKKFKVAGFNDDGEILGSKKFVTYDDDRPGDIDVGWEYAADTDMGVEQTQESTLPNSAELGGSEEIVLRDVIWWAIPRNKAKLRRRFNEFLKCSTMVDIASAANTSKQNIHKQFQAVVRRVLKIISKSRPKSDYAPTPYKLKLDIIA